MPQDVGARIRDLLGRLRRTSAPAEPKRTQSSDSQQPLEGEPLEGLAPARRLGLHRPSAFATALLVLALAVAFLGTLTYYGARKFTRDAADVRASEEANSLASQSSFSATGDAFNGYLQILRYADDPVVRARTATEDERRNALQQLLYLNTNKLSALAIAGRDGTIFATTHESILDVRSSEAFNRTRGNLSPTNSDIILPEGSLVSYLEFTAPIKDPDGAVWAILYARADPDVLWAATLRTSVDGSRNVILNSEGLFAAGVPADMQRQPWRGAPLKNGSVRAGIVGIDSICGLGPIGQGTQIDHGWHVASCLPISLIQREADRAMGQQVLVTSAGAVLAIVLAAGMLWLTLNRPAPQSSMAPLDEEQTEASITPEVPPIALDPPVVTDEPPPTEETAHAIEPVVLPVPSQPVVAADVDALSLIEAYEARAAAIAGDLRDSVQARILVAVTRASEAFRLKAEHPDRAEEMHAGAMADLDALRDAALRNISQEMHPSLIRLGLPAALRALAKEMSGDMAVSLRVDAAVDSAGGGPGRVAIDTLRRLIVFRAVRGILKALQRAGAAGAQLTLTRDGEWLHLRIASGIPEDIAVTDAMIAPDAIGFAAYAGTLTLSRGGRDIAFVGSLHAPGLELIEATPAGNEAESESGGSDGPEAETETAEQTRAHYASPGGPIVTFAAPLHGAEESLGGALRAFAAEMAGTVDVAVETEPAYDQPGAIDGEVAGSLRMLAGDASRALAAAGATACSIRVRRAGEDTSMTIAASVDGDMLAADALSRADSALKRHGGGVAIREDGGVVAITAIVPARVTEAEDIPLIVPLVRVDGAATAPDDASDAA